MMIETTRFNLAPEEAIVMLRRELVAMRAGLDRTELKDISSDDALEIGYEMAIQDYERLTGPNPIEIGAIEVPFRFVDEEIPNLEEEFGNE